MFDLVKHMNKEYPAVEKREFIYVRECNCHACESHKLLSQSPFKGNLNCV